MSSNLEKEVDAYTNYCRLLDHMQWVAGQYADKATNAAEAALNMVTAAFPYGVGSAIMAGIGAATLAIETAADVAEGLSLIQTITDKLNELTPPEGGC